jgi:hypothetical protein
MSAVPFSLTTPLKTVSLLTSRIALAVAAGLLAMTILGCPSRTSIGHITKNPGNFAGREITIAGRVKRSVGAIGNGIFQIDDGSGRIWVYSQGLGVPSSGSKAAITGYIQQGISFGGRSFAVVMKETRRQH